MIPPVARAPIPSGPPEVSWCPSVARQSFPFPRRSLPRRWRRTIPWSIGSSGGNGAARARLPRRSKPGASGCGTRSNTMTRPAASGSAATPSRRSPGPSGTRSPPLPRCRQAQVRQALHALVATLPDRLRGIVVRHYGLAGTLPQTFAQIGHRWGISRQRVHQLHQQALVALAQPARSHALRRLVDRQQRRDYQRALARQRRPARARRRCPR
jgi:hypothetical protein